MREFHKKGKKNTVTWRVWTNKNEVHTQSGIYGGNLKHTYDVPGSVGKAGTKAFIPPEAQALLVAERKIRKKIERGYYEVDPETGEAKGSSARSLDFTRLPKNLAFFKPRRWPTTKKETELLNNVIESNRDILTIKRDGMMHAVLITTDRNIKIYSRRMDDCTDSYPHLVKWFSKMQLPPETILACEFVVPTSRGDDRDAMASISRSLPKRAVKLQQARHKAHAVILSAPFWAGQPKFDEPVEAMFSLLEFLRLDHNRPTGPYISIIEVYWGSFDEAKEHCLNNELEGLVIYDEDTTFGEQAYNFRGEPERPECWKWKPQYEDDFVVMWNPKAGQGSLGKGRLMGLPGQVALYQYDSSYNLTFICLCGSGFTDEQRKALMNAAEANEGRAGVAIIKYVGRGYISEGHKSNALREPVFVGWHPDKALDETINERL